MKVTPFTFCPRVDCDAKLIAHEGGVVCAKGHGFDVYAHGALCEVLADYKRAEFLYVDADAFMTIADRGARLWNALVNFSNSYAGKFQGKLLDLAIELRDEAHEHAKAEGREDRTTQMDYEVQHMKAAGWRSYEGRT